MNAAGSGMGGHGAGACDVCEAGGAGRGELLGQHTAHQKADDGRLGRRPLPPASNPRYLDYLYAPAPALTRVWASAPTIARSGKPRRS